MSTAPLPREDKMPIENEVIHYLDSIEAINEAERLNDANRIDRAYAAAQKAWAAVPSKWHNKLAPPPERPADLLS